MPVEISEVHELFQWISEIITTLFRLSVVIRNATTRDRYAKAIGSYPAFKDMLQIDLSHVASKFPRIGKDKKTQWLVHRLGNAITRRRQFLYYQHQHRNTMGHIPSAGIESRDQSLAGTGEGTFKQARSEMYNDPFNSAESRGPALTTASTLDASKLTQPVATYLEPQEESDGMSSHATSIATNDGNASTTIVPLIDLKIKGSHFECPYCRDIQDIRTENSWRYAIFCKCCETVELIRSQRKQVLRDLRPYVCTFKNCDSTLFTDQQTWIDHEEDIHRFEWICDFCSVKSFRTEEEFSHHLGVEHTGSFAEAQLPLLLKVSRQAVTQFATEDCPFCYAHDLEKKTRMLNSDIPANSKILLTPTQFYAHVGSHMKGLSLFAISSSTVCEDFNEMDDATSNDSNIAILAHDTKPSGENIGVNQADSKLPSDIPWTDFSPGTSEASTQSEVTDVGPLTEEDDHSEAFNLAESETTQDIEGNEPMAINGQLEVPELAEAVSLHREMLDDLYTQEDAEELDMKAPERTYRHQLLHDKEGQVVRGTLPALVENLTRHDCTPDPMFVSTFFLTFRLFTTPVELAETLVDRFDYIAEMPHIARPVHLRVYNAFKNWLESHWHNQSDHNALSVIERFAEEKLQKIIPAAGRRLSELAQKVTSTDGPLIHHFLSSTSNPSASFPQYVPADTPLPPWNLTKNQAVILKNWKMGRLNATILDIGPLELARQFTIKEMNIFCSIMPEEFLGSEWTKRTGSNAINIRTMLTLSTDLSNLVAYTILQNDSAKERAVHIKHWIKIAYECLELNNYSSLMAIICSLNSSAIIRLKRTWDIISPKRKEILQSLQAIIEPDSNYAVLRKRLHDQVPPCLPFIGIFLTDLTFIDAGNPATKQLTGIKENNNISIVNFEKYTRTTKVICELQRFQIPYRLIEVPELQEWIEAQIVRVSLLENAQEYYYRKSLLLEPREILHSRGSPINPQHGTSSIQKDTGS